jgi:hypothetical protein
MLWQSAVDKTTAEKGFRSVVNSITASATITAGSIAVGTPLVLETNTASNTGYFVNKPATSTSIVNNLFVGILSAAPNANPTYLDREQNGLCQVYGTYPTAIVLRPTAGASVGALLIPESLGFMTPSVGPVTAAATSTSGHTEVPALGGLAALMVALATSAATETTTAPVHLRAC